MYETIILKIERRKFEIKNMLTARYWGLEIDCGADFAEDVYLNNLYEKLENIIKNEAFIKKQREKKGETLKQLSIRYNIPLNTLENRVYNLRWSIERSLTTPIKVIHS